MRRLRAHRPRRARRGPAAARSAASGATAARTGIRLSRSRGVICAMPSPIHPPLSAIALWKSPLATGEPLSMPTMAAPADSPKMVTLFGSPPKFAMLALTHRSVAMESASAWLPDAFRPDSLVSSGCA